MEVESTVGAGIGVVFFRRFVLGRLGGTPSAGSIVMRLVTNFFIPWMSKSMVVRFASDSVMIPQPY
jgi:hypothetical protein